MEAGLIFYGVVFHQKTSARFDVLRFFAMQIPKNANCRRSAINWIYCEDGRIMSTKWMFVR